MSPVRRFRAVSLDLWSTCLQERPGLDDRLLAARLDFLGEGLRTPGDGRIDRERMEQVMRSVHGQLRAQGKDPIEVDPAALVERYAEVLRTRPARAFEELGHDYSAVGFTDDPPEVNPEAETLIAALEARQVPVIALTNTARREESWQEYFRARTNLRFQHVVTSCEVGCMKPHPLIFAEAAKRLHLEPGAILHVGDRWDLDGRGAIDAGFGAVLYTGLWDSYPPGVDPGPGREAAARAGVPCVPRLDSPLLLDLVT